MKIIPLTRHKQYSPYFVIKITLFTRHENYSLYSPRRLLALLDTNNIRLISPRKLLVLLDTRARIILALLRHENSSPRRLLALLNTNNTRFTRHGYYSPYSTRTLLAFLSSRGVSMWQQRTALPTSYEGNTRATREQQNDYNTQNADDIRKGWLHVLASPGTGISSPRTNATSRLLWSDGSWAEVSEKPSTIVLVISGWFAQCRASARGCTKWLHLTNSIPVVRLSYISVSFARSPLADRSHVRQECQLVGTLCSDERRTDGSRLVVSCQYLGSPGKDRYGRLLVLRCCRIDRRRRGRPIFQIFIFARYVNEETVLQ